MMTRPRSSRQAVLAAMLLLLFGPLSAAAQIPVEGEEGREETDAADSADDEDASPAPAGVQPQMPVFTLFGSGAYWKKLGGPPKLVPGTWVEYETRRPNASPEQVRVSVVPQEGLATSEHRILEFRVIEPTGDRNYLKLLLGPGEGMERPIEIFMVKQASLPPMHLPVGTGSDLKIDASQLDGTAGKDSRMKELGVEKVKTPAGEFECRHLEVTVTQEGEHKSFHVWIDAAGKVPVWRIVKAEQGGQTMLLLGSGDGATTDLPPL